MPPAAAPPERKGRCDDGGRDQAKSRCPGPPRAARPPAHPLPLLAILLLPARAIPVAARARVAVDWLMVMTAVTFSRYFVLGPAMQQGTNSPIEKVMTAAYPLADMVLIACLLILVLRPRERTVQPAVRLVAAGLVVLVATDLICGYRRISDTISVDPDHANVVWSRFCSAVASFAAASAGLRVVIHC
jgi:hypothetical protein